MFQEYIFSTYLNAGNAGERRVDVATQQHAYGAVHILRRDEGFIQKLMSCVLCNLSLNKEINLILTLSDIKSLKLKYPWVAEDNT